jgi:hypothetical protein
MKTYEDAVAEFNATKDAEEKALWDEHDASHCPKGQHVWAPGMAREISKCLVCGVIYDGPTFNRWSCRHCGPIAYDPKERRANELRKMLWDGQKAGAIAAPVEKKSVMGFLWSRK